MSNSKLYPIEVQGDFLSKQTHAKPVAAIAELIWNSLDADATVVEIKDEKHEIGSTRIIIQDNGTGFSREDSPGLFGHLGGSWKHFANSTKQKGRFLHGAEGKGRLKAFSLGRVVDWDVCHKNDEGFFAFTVSMLENAMREVRITDAEPAKKKQTGVRCTISELHKEYEFLRSDNTVQELSELFATYLKNYEDVEIILPAGKLDVSIAIASSRTIPFGSITDEGVIYPFELDVIEWKNPTDRAIYFCNDAGFPLSQADARLHVPGFNFSAYLKSPYISKLSREGLLELGALNPALNTALDKAKEAIKSYYRERGAEKAKSIVDRWKEESVYPYTTAPKNMVEKIERDVFDIVAVNVNNLLPDFDSSPKKGKKLQLRMLRQAIEKSPDELQLILAEVLELPEKKQREFAKLLQETSLTAIISASKVITDRLKFIEGLDVLIFNDEEADNLKERSQLHRLLADNTWIFGEEFSLSVDDKSLTEVLRKHLEVNGLDVVVDKAVKRVDGRAGIVDLMLTRSIPCSRENELEHLVIELKRPTVNIGPKELEQIESYAFAVAADPRFDGIDTRWSFWVVSKGIDEHAKRRTRQANMPPGLVYQSEDKRITIWAKQWSEILQSNRHRLKLFQQKLEFNADRDASLDFLKQSYAAILGGSVTEVSGDDPDLENRVV